MRTRIWVPLAKANKPSLRRVLEGMHRLRTELQQCDEDDLSVPDQDRADRKEQPSLH